MVHIASCGARTRCAKDRVRGGRANTSFRTQQMLSTQSDAQYAVSYTSAQRGWSSCVEMTEATTVPGGVFLTMCERSTRVSMALDLRSNSPRLPGSARLRRDEDFASGMQRSRAALKPSVTQAWRRHSMNILDNTRCRLRLDQGSRLLDSVRTRRRLHRMRWALLQCGLGVKTSRRHGASLQAAAAGRAPLCRSRLGNGFRAPSPDGGRDHHGDGG
jgi:hypothetical protein